MDLTATVNTPSLAYEDMAKHWAPIVALLGGTLAMRAAGTTFLPQFANEKQARYDARLAESVLYEALGHAIDTLSARPFGKTVELGEPTPPWFSEFVLDVDLSGTDLTAFAVHMLRDLLAYGKCHILVEYPNTYQLQQELGRPLSRADETARGVRPYWVRVDPTAVIGWRGAMIGGREQLANLRIRSRQVEQDGQWGEKARDYVTVWTPDQIEVWTKNSDGAWALAADTAPNTMGRVPLVTVYVRRDGMLTAYPPLEKLAWLNVKHWQQSSDQDQIEKMARVPMIALSGYTEEEATSIVVGPFRLVGSRSPEAKAQILETSGAAVSVGRDGLAKLENQMHALAMAPLERRSGNPTATELAIEAGRQVSDLEAYVMRLETGLRQALALAAEWAGLPLEAPEVKISQDFGTTSALEVEMQELREDYRMGVVPQRRYLWERQRRGLYSADMDIDDEIQEARDEHGASLFAGEAGATEKGADDGTA